MEMASAKPPLDPALSALLAPISLAEFESEYWEKRPLHIRRPMPEAYEKLLRGRDLPLLSRQLQLAGTHAQAFFNRAPVDPSELLRDFFEGASIVLNRIDKLWLPLGELCASLRERLHHVFAVMYWTPRGSQAVRAHTDDQDVFIMQLSGCKHWCVYDVPEGHPALPYSHEQLGKSADKPLTPEMLGKPRLELELRAGDLLYLPRGVPHEARADPGCSSLHVTLTVQTSDMTWASLLLDGMHELHRVHEPFRHALPTPMPEADADGEQAGGGPQAGAEAGAEEAEARARAEARAKAEAQFASLMQYSRDNADWVYAKALHLLHARLDKHNGEQDRAITRMREQRPVAVPHHEQLRVAGNMEVVVPELSEEEPLPPNCRVRALFHRRAGNGEYATMELGVPPGMLPALRFIAAERPAFNAHELPELDPCEQHALVARLLQVQVLEVLNSKEDGPGGFEGLSIRDAPAQ